MSRVRGLRPGLPLSLGLIAVILLSGCQSSERIDPTPLKKDGTQSFEFETDDIAQAESASEAVQEYCSGAVSEAQRIGCLSHVDEEDIP